MSKKVSLGAALAMIFVAVAAAVAITMSASVKMFNSIISDLPDRQKLYSSVSEIDDLIRREYYGNIDSGLLDGELFEGYVKGLGDKYSVYMTPSEYSAYKTRAKGTVTGIGVTAGWNASDNQFEISSVSDNSPARAAGLQAGDVVTKIEEIAVTADNYRELSKSFEGERLTTVNITYLRDGKTAVISVVKGYESRAVTYEMYGSVGVIRIMDFYENALSQLNDAVESLTASGASALIIDVRNSSEGEIAVAADMADIFVPLASSNLGAMAKAVNKAGETVETYSSDADEINIPIMLVTNERTEGASEFFAYTLKAFGKAQSVGTASAGRCTLGKIFELSNGGAVLLTVANIIPYNAVSYEDTGVVPDYEVVLSAEQDESIGVMSVSEDPQLSKANALLTGDAQ